MFPFILSPSHAQRQCKPGAEVNLSASAEAPPIKAWVYSPQRYKNFVNEMIPSNYFGEIPGPDDPAAEPAAPDGPSTPP